METRGGGHRRAPAGDIIFSGVLSPLTSVAVWTLSKMINSNLGAGLSFVSRNAQHMSTKVKWARVLVVSCQASEINALWMDEILHHLGKSGMMIPLNMVSKWCDFWISRPSTARPKVVKIARMLFFNDQSGPGSSFFVPGFYMNIYEHTEWMDGLLHHLMTSFDSTWWFPAIPLAF